MGILDTIVSTPLHLYVRLPPPHASRIAPV
jgi:hypothetical protein